ncbi:uncharacterized protein [Hemitrygon akajei]|uniref:uncharacterized protein n=1 Tax=Hemitrygon akajei TaxID=2704970 RepID=UPI003BFA1778
MKPVLQFHVGSTKPSVINKYTGRIDFCRFNGSFVFSNLNYADDGLYRLSVNLRAIIIRYVRLRIMGQNTTEVYSSPGSSVTFPGVDENEMDITEVFHWEKLQGKQSSMDPVLQFHIGSTKPAVVNKYIGRIDFLPSNGSFVFSNLTSADDGLYRLSINLQKTIIRYVRLHIMGLLLADIIIVVSSIAGIISSTVSLTGLIILGYLSRELIQGSQEPLFMCNALSLVTISIALISQIVIKGAASVPVVVLCVVFALLAFNVCLTISFWNLGCQCIRKFLDCTDF